MPVDRLLPSDEAAELIALTRDVADKVLEPIVDEHERTETYPDEVFAFQCDYPDVYLKKWDEGTKQKRLTGVAANDCHHNQILLVKMVDAETVLVGTNVDADDKMRKITADVRSRILKEDVSVNARNVKVITADGHVTLRGPVKNQAEKDLVERIAKDVAGATNVDNQIEVEANP